MAKATTKSNPPKPVGERVLIQFIEEEKAIDGILLPDGMIGATKRARVIEIGEGDLIKQISIGSIVIIPPVVNNEIKIGGDKYYIVHATEILAIIK